MKPIEAMIVLMQMRMQLAVRTRVLRPKRSIVYREPAMPVIRIELSVSAYGPGRSRRLATD